MKRTSQFYLLPSVFLYTNTDLESQEMCFYVIICCGYVDDRYKKLLTPCHSFSNIMYFNLQATSEIAQLLVGDNLQWIFGSSIQLHIHVVSSSDWSYNLQVRSEVPIAHSLEREERERERMAHIHLLSLIPKCSKLKYSYNSLTVSFEIGLHEQQGSCQG